MAPQEQPERHEREVVLLALDAGEECSRPLTAIPAAREGHEPAPDEVAREVLLRDRDLATLPALAELAEVRQEGLLEHDVDGERREETIEGRLRRRVVERVERRGERGRRVGQRRAP